MTKDRFVQLVALLLAVVLLTGSSVLVPTINSQRRELQLSFDPRSGDYVPPHIAILTTALGSFRGLLVDVMWYRAERLKQAGKLYEANTLAEWITTLQPRFPQVWSFMAWNMSYNISVMTHTPEERWSWVQKGIDLLRDQGIVYNPTAVRLYRELGWIFFHKVGQFSDDMHKYYKFQIAERWQELLGAPTEGATTAEAVAAFRPIAVAADRYLDLNRPSRQTRQTLATLAEQYPDHAKLLTDLQMMPLVRFLGRLPGDIAELRDDRQFRLAEALEPLLAAGEARMERAARSPLALLYEEQPATQAVVAQLRDMGLELNEGSLRQVGRMQTLLRYADPAQLLSDENTMLSAQDRALARWLLDTEAQAARDAVLAFWRAKVLLDAYHMDPQYMLELMETFGPLDWRHPSSHAIYWSALGVKVSGELRDATRIDVLNTDRQVIHGLQSLMFYGRLTFSPFTGQVDLLPDPRFIPAYDRAMDLAMERVRAGEYGAGTENNFAAGHENFLLKAIVFTYLYGDEAEARRYLEKARNLYADYPHNQRTHRYEQTLDDFVMNELMRDLEMQNVTRAFIEAMLNRAFSEGLGQARQDVFNRFVKLAQQAHAAYNQKYDYTNPNAGEGRLTLPPFREMLAQVFAAYMRSPGVDLLRRAQVYRGAPVDLVERAFPQFKEPLYAQARQMGLDPERAFPAPPGLTEQAAPVQPADPAQAAPDTVERQ